MTRSPCRTRRPPRSSMRHGLSIRIFYHNWGAGWKAPTFRKKEQGESNHRLPFSFFLAPVFAWGRRTPASFALDKSWLADQVRSPDALDPAFDRVKTEARARGETPSRNKGEQEIFSP